MSNLPTTGMACPACGSDSIRADKVLVTWKYLGQGYYEKPILAALVPRFTCDSCKFVYEDEKALKEKEKVVNDFIKRNTPPNPYVGLATVIKARDDISKDSADNHIRMLPNYCCSCLTIKIDSHTSYAICRLAKDHNAANKNDPHEDLEGNTWWISSEIHPSEIVKS